MRISAALVTSLPVRARPSAIACSVSCVSSGIHGMTASVAWTPHQEIRAVALLKDEDDHAVRCDERDQVQDHRLEREHERAERAREEEEREEYDERDDVRERRVDRVGEVAILRRDAAE
jgi:hypothetical protein